MIFLALKQKSSVSSSERNPFCLVMIFFTSAEVSEEGKESLDHRLFRLRAEAARPLLLSVSSVGYSFIEVFCVNLNPEGMAKASASTADGEAQ